MRFTEVAQLLVIRVPVRAVWIATGNNLDLLGVWGTDPGGPPDFDGNGDVDVVDLLALLGAWGAC